VQVYFGTQGGMALLLQQPGGLQGEILFFGHAGQVPSPGDHSVLPRPKKNFIAPIQKLKNGLQQMVAVGTAPDDP
jgi:hypothetical protein